MLPFVVELNDERIQIFVYVFYLPFCPLRWLSTSSIDWLSCHFLFCLSKSKAKHSVLSVIIGFYFQFLIHKMPKPTKLHPKGKSSTIQKSCNKEKDGTDINIDPEQSLRQFQLELCWCIQQCEKYLNEKKGTEKQSMYLSRHPSPLLIDSSNYIETC